MPKTILIALLFASAAARADTPDARLVSAHTAFAFDLLHQLSATPGANVFFSPFSIAAAVEMTYNGASGQTKAEMAKTLHIDGFSLDEVNQSSETLRLDFVGADPKVEIAVANSLWAQEGFPFLPDFVGRNKRWYGAEVSSLSLGVPGAPARINSWVRTHTKGKIDQVVNDLPPNTRLVVVNAVYFRGRWTSVFDRRATLVDPFNLQDGTSTKVAMMSQAGTYQYLKGDTFQAVRLPYGAERFAMYVLLPTRRSGLPDFLRRIDSDQVTKWMTAMASTPGSIKLPRFRVDYGRSLNQALQALGIVDAFDGARSDFTGMTGMRDLFIGAVQHRAFVEVNEEGTVAAASTAVSMGRGEAPKSVPFAMRVDHPFLCAIRDDKTGEILFLGAIYDPTK